jgi:hypothetical protein
VAARAEWRALDRLRRYLVCPARCRCAGGRLDDRLVRDAVRVPVHRARLSAEEVQTAGVRKTMLTLLVRAPNASRARYAA